MLLTCLDVEFWNRCLYLDICPKFVKFKPPKLKQYDSNDQLFRQVACNSLKLAEKEHSDSKRRFYKFRQAVIGKLSLLEKRVLTHLLNKHFETTAKKKRSSHNKKLLNTWTKDRPRSPDCIKNLSSRTLSVEEQNVLYRGLKHHILPDKVSPEKVKVGIEKLINGALYHEAANMGVGQSSWRDKSTEEKDQIKNNISMIAQSKIDATFRENVQCVFQSFMSACRTVCSVRGNRALHKTLSSLSKDDSIRVCSFDKGTGVCVLDKSDYFSKLDVIINDTSKFEKVVTTRSNAKHPILKRQESVRDAISVLLKDHVTTDQYKKLVPKGSGPGKLYGMYKITKKITPCDRLYR